MSMGQDELIASLQSQAEERIASLWEEARMKAREMREEKEKNLARMRVERETHRLEAADGEARDLLREADAEVRDGKLQAETAASARLFRTAVSLLASLREGGYEATFRALVEELPSFPWSMVKVNPVDADLARALFPDADIVVDESIRGGLETGDRDDRVRVVNTFEGRLESAWEDLLPLMLADAEAPS